MSEIKSTISLVDRVSATLKRIHQATTQSIQAGERLGRTAKIQEQAMNRQGTATMKAAEQMNYFVNKSGKIVNANGRFVSAVEFARSGLKKEELALREVANRAEQTSSKMSKLTGITKGAGNAFGGIKGLIAGAVGGLALGGAAKGLLQQSDEYANMTARLNMINDGQRTTAMLQK